MPEPGGVLSRPYTAASVAIYTMVALSAFEGLAVAAALPHVAGDLGDVGLLPWVVAGFFFTSGVATIAAGPLIDTLGARSLFRWAAGVFVAASALAAAAPTMLLLVVARLVQGLGAGLIMSVTLAAVGLVYPARLVPRAFAANSTVWGVVGVAGPGIAALMLTVLDWRWIFLINVPLGAIALAAGWRALPGPVGERGGRFDGRGALILAAFTLAVLLAVDALEATSALWAGAALGAGALYVRHARRRPDPVLRLEHVAAQPYRGIGLSMALLLAGAVGAHSYLTLYVGGGRGAGPTLTAWSVFFFTIGWTIGSNVVGRMRIDTVRTLTAGFAVTVPALAAVSVAAFVGAPLWVVLAAFLLAGSGVGAAANTTLTLLQTESAPSELGRTTAAHQFLRNQGFTLGSALGGTLLLAVAAGEVGDLDAVRALFSGAADVSAGAAAAIRRGFALTAAAGTVVAAAGLLPVVALRRHLAPSHPASGPPKIPR